MTDAPTAAGNEFRTVASYRLSPGPWSIWRKRGLRLAWTVNRLADGFAGFRLVASQEGPPLSADDGVELHRWHGYACPREGRHEVVIVLDPVLPRRWATFYCKLFVLDPAQDRETLVIHPDTCVAIDYKGRLQVSWKPVPPRRYSPKPPRTVVCPECFEEFPVERMKFGTTPDDKSPMEGKCTVRDRTTRLLGRRIWPPKEHNWKFCPGNHRLPWTAGLRETLIIGLVGDRNVGKVTYIAALVSQLEGRAGSDIGMTVMPVMDETRERYRSEFKVPLFDNHRTLPMTVGTPPPLIYDLQIEDPSRSERDVRRAVLALCYTAGENLKNREVAERLAKYVGVASGIMLMVDPLQIDAVRHLCDQSILPRKCEGPTPREIIGSMLGLLEDGRALTGTAPLSIPMAVVLTKCDVLRDAGLIPENRLWSLEGHRHVGGFDRRLHDDMSGMMGEYMRKWDLATYNVVMQRIPNHAFFGVSATGCSPDNTGRYPFVRPWRVEDPLLWLLSEWNVLPVRNCGN